MNKVNSLDTLYNTYICEILLGNSAYKNINL